MPDLKSLKKKLLAWYEENARDLPWRRTRDPYKIWISEVMLQQTTVATVIPYYERWIRLFPGLEDVARAPLKKVLKSWQGLGYYARARHIHEAARIIEQGHAGRLPNDPQALRCLPGFGPYTTGAVASIAFGLPVPIIDANIRRVVTRWKADGVRCISLNDAEINSFLEALLPQEDTGIFNQALMEIGALVCRARRPLCVQCPVTAFCSAYKLGVQNTVPAVKKKQTEKIEAAAILVEHRGKYLMRKRPAAGLWAGLWEFPATRIKKGEKARDVFKKELGVLIADAVYLGTLRHSYTRFRVDLGIWRVRLKGALRLDSRHKWMGPKEMKKYPMPQPVATIVKEWIKCL